MMSLLAENMYNGGIPTVSALPAPSRKAVQRGTGQGLTSGFGMGPGVSPVPMTVGNFMSNGMDI